MKNSRFVQPSISSRRFCRAALTLGLCAGIAGLLALTTPAQASPAQFIGLWNNVDPNTNHIVQFVISGAPGALAIRTFGKCSPTPCDWGAAPLTTYGNDVSDPDHKYATALYNFGFEADLMTFELTDPVTLVVDTYTQFLDHSGRENYHVREIFRKVVPIPKPPLPLPGHLPF